jgi:hypothetical protein
MVCTFLIVRGNPPVLLEPVDQPLYTLTQPINRSIKRTASMFIFLTSLDRPTGHERFEPNGFVPLSRQCHQAIV